jgi:hypothetical protein
VTVGQGCSIVATPRAGLQRRKQGQNTVVKDSMKYVLYAVGGGLLVLCKEEA